MGALILNPDPVVDRTIGILEMVPGIAAAQRIPGIFGPLGLQTAGAGR